MPIFDQQPVIHAFCEAAISHAGATELGEVDVANAAYCRIIEALQWLEAHQATAQLLPLLPLLLASTHVGPRNWAASYLLLQNHPAAVATLEQLAASTGIHAFTAGMTLREWRAGRLKPFF